MKRFISMVVIAAILVMTMSAFSVSAAPAFMSSIDQIGADATGGAHGGTEMFTVPAQCTACSHTVYDEIYPGECLSAIGWLATDAGVSKYQYSVDGGATWVDTAAAIMPRDDLAAHSIPYTNGHATAGFLVSVCTYGWALGTYDVMIAAVDGNGESVPFLTFQGVEIVEDTTGGDVDDISDITYGKNYKLTADITGDITLSEGVYVFDLNGHTWNGGTVITGTGANITIVDTSAAGTGKINATSDAINVKAGTLNAKGIEVVSTGDGCDGFWIQGGITVIEDCVVTANGNAAVHNRNDYGARVTVNGGSYSGKYALKSKFDGGIVIGGECELSATVAEYYKDTCTLTFEQLMTASEGYVVSFAADAANADYADVTVSADPDYVPSTDEPTDSPAGNPTDAPTGTPSTPSTPDTGDGDVTAFVVIALMAAAVAVVATVMKKRA